MPEGPALHADPFVGTVLFLSLVFDEELVVGVAFNVNRFTALNQFASFRPIRRHYNT